MDELPKTTAQRLLHWRFFLEEFGYDIMHIPGEKNCWSDLLSRLLKIGEDGDGNRERSPSVRTVAVNARADTNCDLPSKSSRKASQLQVALENKQNEVNLTMFGALDKDFDSLFQISWEGRHGLLIPEGFKRLQPKLIVYSHMDASGHRKILTNLQELRSFCVWVFMEVNAAAYVE